MKGSFLSGFSAHDFYNSIRGVISRGFNPEKLGLILSASGWRGVFSSDEENRNALPLPEMGAAALAMAGAAAEFFIGECRTINNSDLQILLGCDARPTGSAIVDIFTRVFLLSGLNPSVTGISAAPEIMAAARNTAKYAGFCYISASHNPVGHNGVKLGRTDGGVLPGEDAAPLIEKVRKNLQNPALLTELCNQCMELKDNTLSNIYSSMDVKKSEILNDYSRFTTEVVFGNYADQRTKLISNLKELPLGVVGELNGSARGVSIDGDFFAQTGLKYRLINDTPGKDIVHPILPEGDNLNDCCRYLEKVYSGDPDFQLGYVPDNDGDRGNLVYIDPETGKAHALGAQEVFALSVLSELSCERLFSRNASDLAVAVNGPTSIRIDRIAELFDAQVYRAEVGEANVVNLARKIRNSGSNVRILGEGSNGGTITYPAAVRDPLNTILAFVKLLRLKTTDGITPAEEWLNRAGKPLKDGEKLSIRRILDSLPVFQTTPTGESRAKYPVKTADHNLLKSRYETVFTENWIDRPALINDLGITDYRFINYEGIETILGPGGRKGTGRGGFKVELTDKDGKACGFLWMRGSGTEPVFRVMADIASPEAGMEETLLNWHREVLKEADNAG